MIKRAIFSHYDGLGDYFVCNGLTNLMSAFFDELHIPVPECYFDTLSCLYQHNQKINLFCSYPQPDSESLKKYAIQNNIKLIIDKCWQHPHNRTTFQTDFYKWCNVDYSIRYTHCFIPNTQSSKNFFKQHIKHKQFTIVHNTGGCGRLNINVQTKYPVFEINHGLTNNLLDYVDIIQQAKEIHVVDSSLYHLIDNMNVEAQLFFHDIRNKPGDRITISEKWTKIFYAEEIII